LKKIPKPDDFIIEIWCSACADFQDMDAGRIEIDLSRPEFEAQVLAAAGRFNSLRRQSRRGGRQVVPVKCGECGEELPTRAIAEHRREKHGAAISRVDDATDS
jgi:hypothetical protein